jgi:hypothetical protein
MSKLYFTSSASTGSPLLKRAFGFRRNVIDDLSGATSISSASSPYIVIGSSPLRIASGSFMKICTPAGALPLTVK